MALWSIGMVTMIGKLKLMSEEQEAFAGTAK